MSFDQKRRRVLWQKTNYNDLIKANCISYNRSMLNRSSKALKSLLKMCDMFSISQFVKYKRESDYKTATGGFCSITVLTIFAVMFTSMAIRTVDREIITWTSETENSMEPSPTTVEVSPQPFLFTIGVLQLNLNDPHLRYFDFTMTEKVQSGPNLLSSRSINLVQCTEQHFSITAGLRQRYKNVPASTWLCPPLGQKFTLYGKFTSQSMSFLQISVKKCDPALNPSRPCANTTVMQQYQAQMGQFIMSQFFINPLLNPGGANYIDYYLEDRNYIAFTSKLGAYSNVHVQDFTIITDQSILPYVVPKEDIGVIVPDLFQNINFEVTSSLLAQQFFYKSSASTTYNRAYYKVDEFFSYVGGLVGVIMGGMFLLSAYNQDSFEFSLAKDLFKKDDNRMLSKYNIFYYVVLFFYPILSKFSEKCRGWKIIQKFQETRDEMARQLDVSFILTRLLFLERSIQVIFQKGQFEAMHLNDKPTLEHLKTLRRYYRMRDKVTYPYLSIKHESPSLQESQGNLDISRDVKLPPQEQEDSDDQEINEQQLQNFKEPLKQFQESIEIGNETSLKIMKGIKRQERTIEFENIFNVPKSKDLKSSIQEMHISEQQLPPFDPKTQFLRIKPNKKLSSTQNNHPHFDFVTFVQ